MINYRLPGNAAQARVFGGLPMQISPGTWRNRNPIAQRVLWENEYASFPVGFRAGALILPMKDGGIRVILTGDADVTAAINGLGNAGGTLTGAASVTVPPYGLTALRQAVANITQAATLTASINGRGSVSAQINVSQLTSTDVTGAVLDALVENGLTVKEALRLLLAVAVGKTDIDTSGPVVVKFRDTADTVDRVTATMTGSERTTVVLDPD